MFRPFLKVALFGSLLFSLLAIHQDSLKLSPAWRVALPYMYSLGGQGRGRAAV